MNNSMAAESQSKDNNTYRSVGDDDFGSPFQGISSPGNYNQSLDQYFLGGIHSSKSHLRTLKTITDNRPMRNKWY